MACPCRPVGLATAALTPCTRQAVAVPAARRRVVASVARAQAREGNDEDWEWNDGFVETVVLYEEPEPAEQLPSQLNKVQASDEGHSDVLPLRVAGSASQEVDCSTAHAAGTRVDYPEAYYDDSSDEDWGDEDWDEDWGEGSDTGMPILTSPVGALLAVLPSPRASSSRGNTSLGPVPYRQAGAAPRVSYTVSGVGYTVAGAPEAAQGRAAQDPAAAAPADASRAGRSTPETREAPGRRPAVSAAAEQASDPAAPQPESALGAVRRAFSDSARKLTAAAQGRQAHVAAAEAARRGIDGPLEHTSLPERSAPAAASSSTSGSASGDARAASPASGFGAHTHSNSASPRAGAASEPAAGEARAPARADEAAPLPSERPLAGRAPAPPHAAAVTGHQSRSARPVPGPPSPQPTQQAPASLRPTPPVRQPVQQPRPAAPPTASAPSPAPSGTAATARAGPDEVSASAAEANTAPAHAAAETHETHTATDVSPGTVSPRANLRASPGTTAVPLVTPTADSRPPAPSSAPLIPDTHASVPPAGERRRGAAVLPPPGDTSGSTLQPDTEGSRVLEPLQAPGAQAAAASVPRSSPAPCTRAGETRLAPRGRARPTTPVQSAAREPSGRAGSGSRSSASGRSALRHGARARAPHAPAPAGSVVRASVSRVRGAKAPAPPARSRDCAGATSKAAEAHRNPAAAAAKRRPAVSREAATCRTAPGGVRATPGRPQDTAAAARAPRSSSTRGKRATKPPSPASGSGAGSTRAGASPERAADLRSLSHPWEAAPADEEASNSAAASLGSANSALSAAAPLPPSQEGLPQAELDSRSGATPVSAPGPAPAPAASQARVWPSAAARVRGVSQKGTPPSTRNKGRSNAADPTPAAADAVSTGVEESAGRAAGAGSAPGQGSGAGAYSATSLLARLPRPWEDGESDQSSVPSTSGAATLSAFLVEQGMSGLQAENCALELEGTDSPYTDTAALGAKMAALGDLLPGVNICNLILYDRQVLTTDVGEAAQRMILFDDLLGGPDLAELLSRTPVLLHADDVREALVLALDKLRALLPAQYPHSMLQSTLVDAPMLIFRMDYYMHVQTFGELPFDVQNLFHVAGGMSGSVYKSWSGFKDNNND